MDATSPKALAIFDKFRDNHSPEYTLEHIHEVYFPFFDCKGEVVAETNLQLDRLSKILLTFLTHKATDHQALCGFLGIEDDSFLLSHLHHLIKEGFIVEQFAPHSYHLSLAGTQFLKGISESRTMEQVTFLFQYNAMLRNFFDPDFPIDHGVSAAKKTNFKGYRMLQTNKIEPNGHRTIPHGKRPRIEQEERATFANWFNSRFPNHQFYDLDTDSPKSHARSVSFLVLEFQDETNSKKYEVRRHEKTVTGATQNELEEALTKAFTKYMVENPRFLDPTHIPREVKDPFLTRETAINDLRQRFVAAAKRGL